MAAVVARLRAELRRRWAAWLGVALVAGLGGGVVLGLFAGAARTTKAYPEFVAAMSAADVLVGGNSPFVLREGRFAGAVDLDDIAALPQVKNDARASVSLLFTGRTGAGRRVGPVDLLPVIPDNEQLGSTHRAVVDGVGTRGGSQPGRRGHREFRARRTAAPRGRQHAPPQVREGLRIRGDRAATPEQLRQTPEPAIPPRTAPRSTPLPTDPTSRSGSRASKRRRSSSRRSGPTSRPRSISRPSSRVATATRSCRTRSCTCSSRSRNCWTRSPRASNGWRRERRPASS